MRNRISPVRTSVEFVLDLFGLGPRRSSFTPARHPESRMRFAQYVSRIQPAPDPAAARRTARLLGNGGAVSRGIIRHAPTQPMALPSRRPAFSLFTQPGTVAALRRARAHQPETPWRLLLHALRAR